tara:strand:+ start:254637 stop:255635 length:999 start_codon:yes stop_codon:yes gene_type:complete
MPNSEITADSYPSHRIHRLAVLAVCLVWPLIWIGGLVTTYDAGMAVPDWPATYGYNLFLYPYKTWLLGPFDLFIEHGHRLLGAVVGFVAIAIVIAAVRTEHRIWVRWLAVGLLVAVILQGMLGGFRVLLGDRTVAMIHGCFGPAFFALCVATAAVTSRFWWSVDELDDSKRIPGKGLIALSGLLLATAYIQLVLGAQLRHLQPDTRPGWFTMMVAMHVMTAVGLWLLTALAWLRLRRCGDLTLSRPGLLLIGLVALQIILGVGTWVVNYGWPSFLQWVPGSTGFLLRSKGFIDSLIVTSHVATGSLILAICTLIFVRSLRIRSVRSRSPVTI